MGWKGKSGGLVVVDYGVSRVIYDVVDGDSSMVVCGGVPSVMMSVQVSCNDVIVIGE